MDTLKSGDVIIADFPGVTGIKRRPVQTGKLCRNVCAKRSLYECLQMRGL